MDITARIFGMTFATLLFGTLLIGCTRTVYGTKENVSRDSVTAAEATQYETLRSIIERMESTRATSDSVVIRDSVIITVSQSGDILRRDVIRDRQNSSRTDNTVSRMRSRYDSLIATQSRQIEQIRESMSKEPVIVEKPPSLWSRFKADVVAVLTMMVAILVIARAIKRNKDRG